MFAVYATHADPENPLAALKIGERPEPTVPASWVRVKVSHASLNRHDLFTLRGITAHPEGIAYPMILGNDAAGTLDDGTPVVIYPLMGSDDWRGDETLDPAWHIPSEFIAGTFADYAVVPNRNAIPLPSALSPLHASVLGTAWLTAYQRRNHNPHLLVSPCAFSIGHEETCGSRRDLRTRGGVVRVVVNVAFRVMWPTLASHVLPGEKHVKGTTLRQIIAHPCAEPSTSSFPSRIRCHELPGTASACRTKSGRPTTSMRADLAVRIPAPGSAPRSRRSRS
jgi:hypothetical protein